MKYIIGIDLGTSAVKVVLFNTEGDIIIKVSLEYEIFQPKNGWAEQLPSKWWEATVDSIKEVVNNSNINSLDIVGLGLSGQMHGLVMLDKDGKVLRPAIIWCDQRSSVECEEITNIVGSERLIELTANPALTGFTASKIMWIKKHEPEIFSKCCHILLPKDYIRYCLSGDFATDVSDASGMQLLDVPNRCWSDEILQKLGIKKQLLAKLYESPEITGTISVEASQITGLSTSTKIVAGASDNAAAAVGLGVVKEKMAFTTIGTSGVVYAHTDRPIIDKKGRVHTFCCAVPNAWHVMGVTQAAGLSLQWLKNNICIPEIKESEEIKNDVYKIMDDKAKRIGIGSDKLIFLPYLMGERTPHLDPDCRGVFFGLSALHTRSHLIRSVMEGVAFSLYDCLLVLDEMNIEADNMLLTGGGAKSTLWSQMLADLFAQSITNLSVSETPALGVAILAAVGTNCYSNVEEACSAMVRGNTNIMSPDKVNTSKYRKHHDLYKNLHKSLKECYKLLGKI
ncbi:MAG: xylulokinase [Spirochaetales bacterium]|nr:xylulokinase [Spirochaetales bacterium]